MRAALIALLLVACDGGGDDRPPSGSAAWTIGPVIGGDNKSRGLPLHPSLEADGFSFAIGPDQEPHYVTHRHGPLTGKTRLRMTYRVEGSGLIHGAGCEAPSAVTLYFQRANDDWRTNGNRWWATFASAPLPGPGVYSIEAPLDGPWTSVVAAVPPPAQFDLAKRQADQVGFTFANCEGYGHGALATAPMKFVVTSFEVL